MDEGEEICKKEGGGAMLLGWPTFKELGNGRFKCLETGHELVAECRESYGRTKHCRLGLIDSALALNKPPLNMFLQHPLSRSKLTCKLTGLTINKTEEHIWKHINGKRFLNMLEKKEAEKQTHKGSEDKREQKQGKVVKKTADGSDYKKKKKQIKDGNVKEIISKARNMSDNDSDSEDEFWMPPSSECRVICKQGGQWGSDLDSGREADDVSGAEHAEDNEDLQELPNKVKRLSIEIGPSAFASRKKKKKVNPTSQD